LAIAERFAPELTIIGPEAPLAAGLVDQLRLRDFAVVGPTASAAQIETSKAFAKALMDQAGIPTARYTTSDTAQHAAEALKNFGLPVVLKADGLASGKGVIIAESAEDAQAAVIRLFGVSRRIVIEEHLRGREVSFIALTDGNHILPLEPAQDHKRLFDDDQGPNTGGMGAYSEAALLNDADRARILDTIMEPAITHMRRHHEPFTGFLYAGLMMTDDGPRVLEFNARLGDPETQALMLRFDSDFASVLTAAAQGRLHEIPDLTWSPDPAVCVVLASAGYPDNPRVGDPIFGLDQVDSALAFQAGTKLHENSLITNGGRVLGITASAATLRGASEIAYREVDKIHFDGMQFRRDIGRAR
jgi:phosphoribosylamine--glycine ligase